MMALTQQLEGVMRELYHPDGLNLGMNLGKAAGAGVAATYMSHSAALVRRRKFYDRSGRNQDIARRPGDHICTHQTEIRRVKVSAAAPDFRAHPQKAAHLNSKDASLIQQQRRCYASLWHFNGDEV